jgi:hypothetical protein
MVLTVIAVVVMTVIKIVKEQKYFWKMHIKVAWPICQLYRYRKRIANFLCAT